MHDLLLYGQVSSNDHRKIVHQLSGVTRMQPTPVVERHILFEARTPVGLNSPPSGGGSQGVLPTESRKIKTMLSGNLYFLQLVAEVPKSHFGSANHIESFSGSSEKVGGDMAIRRPSGSSLPQDLQLQWLIEFCDLPDPGKQPVTARLVCRTMVEAGDPFEFLRNFGYDFVSQFVIEGYRFYDQDTTLFLHRVLQLPIQQAGELIGPSVPLPALEELTPLDGSGAYVLSASIEVVDGNNPELKEKAVQQLLSIKETLKATVTLAPGDRLALDTRVSARSRRP